MKILLLLVAFLAITINSANINPDITKTLETKENVDIMIFMKSSVNLNTLTHPVTGENVLEMEPHGRGELVVNSLKNYCQTSQQDILKILKKYTTKSYWISNSISIRKADKALLKLLSERSDVGNVDINEMEENDREKPSRKSTAIEGAIPQHIKAIKAHKLWKKGFKGEGITFGLSATGVQPNHPAIKASYRGTKQNGQFNHNYNWFDPYANNPVATDVFSQGTHLAGVLTANVDNIGIAPKSKYIGCMGISLSGEGTLEGYNACLQFFLAPWDLNKQNPNPSLRPHITVHPYTCRRCQVPNLQRCIQALTAAGVAVVSETGFVTPNPSDPQNQCRRLAKPPAVYPETLTVGGLGLNNSILLTSPGGPACIGDRRERATTICRNENNGIATEECIIEKCNEIPVKKGDLTKPDIVTLGENVVSSVVTRDQGTFLYAPATGSSVSATVAAGALGLLWEAVPYLQRKVAISFEILKKSAKPKRNNCCGGKKRFNNIYGAGKLNLVKAVKLGKRYTRKMCRKCFKKCIWGREDVLQNIEVFRRFRRRRKRCRKKCKPICKYVRRRRRF